MDSTICIGTLVALGALGAIVVLSLWAFRTIERITEKRLDSVRDIVRELSNER